MPDRAAILCKQAGSKDDQRNDRRIRNRREIATGQADKKFSGSAPKTPLGEESDDVVPGKRMLVLLREQNAHPIRLW